MEELVQPIDWLVRLGIPMTNVRLGNKERLKVGTGTWKKRVNHHVLPSGSRLQYMGTSRAWLYFVGSFTRKSIIAAS